MKQGLPRITSIDRREFGIYLLPGETSQKLQHPYVNSKNVTTLRG